MAHEATGGDVRPGAGWRGRRWQRLRSLGGTHSRQVRELAIAGARQLAGTTHTESERHALLEALAESFEHPETAGIDWEVLRDGKRRAWPIT